MIVTVPVCVTGDAWYNPKEFKQNLQQLTVDQQLMLDLRSEGPCLSSLGVTQCVAEWAKSNGRTLDSIAITRWSNGVESVPYQRIECNKHSHFFKYSQGYWTDGCDTPDPAQHFFGVFLGRRTLARNIMIYDICNSYNQDLFLLSQMKTQDQSRWPFLRSDIICAEKLEDWISLVQQDLVFDWINSTNIASIDNRSVADQYTVVEQSMFECARSLLSHYCRFNIEIVAESYTMGDCFFPTEKTVRPLMAGKPIVVYGPPGYLDRLRGLGFETYSSCWNEDYDGLEGAERWQAMKNTINQLTTLHAVEKKAMLRQAHAIAMHNRKILEKQVFDDCKNF